VAPIAPIGPPPKDADDGDEDDESSDGDEESKQKQVVLVAEASPPVRSAAAPVAATAAAVQPSEDWAAEDLDWGTAGKKGATQTPGSSEEAANAVDWASDFALNPITKRVSTISDSSDGGDGCGGVEDWAKEAAAEEQVHSCFAAVLSKPVQKLHLIAHAAMAPLLPVLMLQASEEEEAEHRAAVTKKGHKKGHQDHHSNGKEEHHNKGKEEHHKKGKEEEHHSKGKEEHPKKGKEEHKNVKGHNNRKTHKKGKGHQKQKKRATHHHKN
jgi:hypothetical protein